MKIKTWILTSMILTGLAQGPALAADNTFPTSGDVGIGTTSPQALLDLGPGEGDAYAQKFLLLNTAGGLARSGWGHVSYEDRMFWPSDGHFSLGTMSLTDGTTWSELMRINNDGNVGIGTTSPQSKLHVAGTMRLYGDSGSYGIYFEPAGANNVGIHKLSNEGAPWGGSFTSFDDFTPTTADLLLLGYEGISLGTRKDGDTLGLRLASSGNVGIGTTSPGEKLDVAGNIKLSGNIVSDGDICIGACD